MFVVQLQSHAHETAWTPEEQEAIDTFLEKMKEGCASMNKTLYDELLKEYTCILKNTGYEGEALVVEVCNCIQHQLDAQSADIPPSSLASPFCRELGSYIIKCNRYLLLAGGVQENPIQSNIEGYCKSMNEHLSHLRMNASFGVIVAAVDALSGVFEQESDILVEKMPHLALEEVETVTLR